MDRIGIELPGLPPGITLTSTEDDDDDGWRIYYDWELTPSREITFIVSAAEVEGLVSQAKEFAEANKHDFALAEARRQAADKVVVRQIRETIARDPALAAWRGA